MLDRRARAERRLGEGSLTFCLSERDACSLAQQSELGAAEYNFRERDFRPPPAAPSSRNRADHGDGASGLAADDAQFRDRGACHLPGLHQRALRAPALDVGDGAPGFWNGLREVFPEAGEGRCWFHETANVLAALPKSAHPGAKKALAEIWNAEDKDHARTAAKALEAAYGAKFPKAAAKITGDLDQLLAFYDYPAEHWVHLRTANPIWVNRPGRGRLADAA